MGSILDLKKIYDDFAAVKGITFDIKEVEIFSLLGFAAVFFVVGVMRFRYE